MANMLYSQDADWQEVRVIAAASVADNFMRTGTAVGSDAAEASTTASVIVATAHAAQAGDVIVMTSGDEDGEARVVSSVATNSITLESDLSGAPSATETFNIIRPQRSPKHDEIKIVIIKSTLNQDVWLSFDGSTNHLLLEAGDDLVLDLKGSNLHVERGDDGDDGTKGYIHVKTVSTAPTTGSLYISTIR